MSIPTQLKTLILLVLTCITSFVAAQDKKKIEEIEREGKHLYSSEMASWYGTDLFLEKYADRSDKIGGYFSYESDNGLITCLFYSREQEPKVLGTVSFDSTFNLKTAIIDGVERKFTELEKQYYVVRALAAKELRTDTLFKTYKNTNLNLIPLIGSQSNKVYVLTGPKISGVVVFGNDYLIEYDKNNNLKQKKALHANIIVTDYQKKNETEKQTAGVHSHLPSTGDYITATDICTLMLYEKYTTWESYYVISDKYVSLWNCKTNNLGVVTKDALEKIEKDQEKRRKQN